MRTTPALRVLPLAALACFLASAAVRAQSPGEGPRPADDLVRAVERRYAVLRTLTANFTQTYRSGELGQSVVERGRLFMRRPGQMRWDYREPEKKVFLVEKDGSTLLYVPSDLRAVRGRLPEEAPHLRLLLGTSDLLASFAATEVTLKDPAVPGARAIKLVPRQPMDGIEMAYLEVDPRMMTVERVLVLDRMGNESDLVFDKVVENAVVKPEAFDVRIPPGVSVKEASPAAGR